MSTTKYFTPRNNKVINDKPTPACSPLPSESLELITAILPHKQPPSKEQQARQGQQGQLPAILLTNPSIRASRHGEGGTGEGKQAAGSTKKGHQPFTGDRAHTAADTDDTLPVQASMTDLGDEDVFADSS